MNPYLCKLYRDDFSIYICLQNTKLKLHRAALFIFIVAAIASCDYGKQEFNKTPCRAASKAPKSQLSSLPLPVKIPLNEIEDIINDEVPRVILKEKHLAKDQIVIEDLVLEKNGRATLKGKNKELFWEAPLKCSFSVSGRKGIAKAVLNKKEISFSILLHMKSTFDIKNNYSLTTRSEIRSHEWIEEPYLDIGPVQIKLTGTLDEFLAQKGADLTHKLDSVIAAKVNVSKPVSKVWNKLHQPVLINKKLKKLWLNVEVNSLEAVKIGVVNDQLHININVNSNLSAQMGDSLPVIDPPPLINLKKAVEQDSLFKLFLHAEIPFKQINELLTRTFGDTNLSYQNFDFEIKNIAALCTGDKLALDLSVGGDVSARAVLSGKPVFDDSTGVLSVGNFEYEMVEKDLLSGTAEMWFREEIKTEIAKALTVNTQNLVNLLPALIEEAVNKDGKKQNLTVNRMMVKPTYLGIHEEMIIIHLQAEGTADIKLLSL